MLKKNLKWQEKKNKLIFWTTVPAMILCLTLVAMLGSGPRKVFAASKDDCLSLSGASNVPSVQDACTLCSDGSRGTLWFNSTADNRNNAIVKVEDPSATKITVYLWGQVYSCNRKTTNTNTAHYIWFAKAGHFTGDSSSASGLTEKVEFLSNNNATLTLPRGAGQNEKYTWFQPMGNKTSLELDIEKFKEYAENNGTKTTNASTGITKYEAKVSVNRCFDTSHGKYLNTSGLKTGESCYGDDVTITMEIASASATSVYGAYSWVNMDGTVRATSDYGGADVEKDFEMETDSDEVTLTFWHQLGYSAPTGAAPGSTFGATKTRWTSTSSPAPCNSPTDPDPDASCDYDGAVRLTDGSASSGPSDWNLSNGGSSAWSDKYGEKTFKVKVPEGEGNYVIVCSKIDYQKKVINWKSVSGGTYEVDEATSSGSEDSGICVKIIRGASEWEDAGRVKYWSTSTVHVNAQNTDVSEHKETSYSMGKDKVTMRLSTDGDKLIAEFWHNMFWQHQTLWGTPWPEYEKNYKVDDDGNYVLDSNGNKILLDEYGSDICTQYSVRYGDGGDKSGTVKYPTDYCSKDYAEYTSSTPDESRTDAVSVTSPEQINLPIDTIKEVCQRIPYQPESFEIQRKWVDDHYIYRKKAGTEMGDGFSEACVEVTRPDDPYPAPDKGPYVGPVIIGNLDAHPMYAGEEVGMGWSAQSKAYFTRRLVEYKEIVFQVDVRQNWSNNTIVKGNFRNGASTVTRNDIEPCWYYQGKLQFSANAEGGACQPYYDQTMNNTVGHVRNDFDNFVVPNYVGDKYCNAYGYRWQYYYSVKHNGVTTKLEPGTTYWTNSDAACNTIAKKPDIALWNGGLSVGANNVTTSTAPRNNGSVYVGRVSSFKGYDTVFGSWTEYVAAINGNVSGFASGATLAWNGFNDKSLIKNSPLTISNQNSNFIGHSGIATNSVLLQRFQTYFREHATGHSLNEIDPNKTNIIRIDGNVYIDNPIILSDSSRSTIYQLPQVVIYTEGNVYINENVKRVDAWIIALNGIVNTCGNSEQLGSSVEANVSNSHYYGNTRCSGELVINGPVFAKKVITNRTYGADGYSNNDTRNGELPYINVGDKRAVSAEVFNLSADAYLWAYAQAGRYSSSYSEAYSRELPPRY